MNIDERHRGCAGRLARASTASSVETGRAPSTERTSEPVRDTISNIVSTVPVSALEVRVSPERASCKRTSILIFPPESFPKSVYEPSTT